MTITSEQEYREAIHFRNTLNELADKFDDRDHVEAADRVRAAADDLCAQIETYEEDQHLMSVAKFIES